MASRSIYDTMRQMMPFYGLNETQFTEVIEITAFDFAQFGPREVFLSEGDDLCGVMFLLGGMVEMTTMSFDHRIKVVQTFQAPKTMPLHYMFGASIQSHCQLKSLTKCSLAYLTKRDMVRAMQKSDYVLVNTMNHLCTLSQKEHKAFDFMGKPNGTERLASWLLSVTDRDAIDITIECDMDAWCDLLRLNENEFWRHAATLEGRYAIEFDNEKRLHVIDRYEIKRFLSGAK